MRRYVTLFDSKYIVKGALMLESLARHSSAPYEVEIVALDDRVAQTNFPNAHATRLTDLEAAVPELGVARGNRGWREYCWTLASVALRWFLDKAEPGEVVTYIDADLGFFGDPEACFTELGERSIGIVPHNFASVYRHYAASAGVYNVSWVSLRNDDAGKACADEWARQVLARCSESEGCGDQCYLDRWPAAYGNRLCIFNSPGIGVAPWNVSDYKVDGSLCVFGSPGMGVGPENVFGYKVQVDSTGVSVNGHQVVFYHYHEFCKGAAVGRGLCLDEFSLSGYPLRSVDVDVFYRDYCRRYRELEAQLRC